MHCYWLRTLLVLFLCDLLGLARVEARSKKPLTIDQVEEEFVSTGQALQQLTGYVFNPEVIGIQVLDSILFGEKLAPKVQGLEWDGKQWKIVAPSAAEITDEVSGFTDNSDVQRPVIYLNAGLFERPKSKPSLRGDPSAVVAEETFHAMQALTYPREVEAMLELYDRFKKPDLGREERDRIGLATFVDALLIEGEAHSVLRELARKRMSRKETWIDRIVVYGFINLLGGHLVPTGSDFAFNKYPSFWKDKDLREKAFRRFVGQGPLMPSHRR